MWLEKGCMKKYQWLLVAAILLRLLLLLVPPVSSNDWIRYYWDGRIASVGLDPYSVTPAESRLTVGIRVVGGCCLVLAMTYGYAHLRGWSAVGSLWVFLRHWEFGSPWLFFPTYAKWMVGALFLIPILKPQTWRDRSELAWIVLWGLSP